MKTTDEDRIDRLLRQAYDLDTELRPGLTDKVTAPAAQAPAVRRPRRLSRPAMAAIIAAVFLLVSTVAYAASHFLGTEEAAACFGPEFQELFQGQTVTEIGQSVTSGDYTFTLMATAVSDTPLWPVMTDHLPDGHVLGRDRQFYAIVAVERLDGSEISDFELQDMVMTPLVKGQVPWRVNTLATGFGSKRYFRLDGVQYVVIDCFDFAIFADQGLYFAVTTDLYIGRDTFLFDEDTGEITMNPDYDGVCALFDLPLDQSFADPEAAQELLEYITHRYYQGVAGMERFSWAAMEAAKELFLTLAEPLPGSEKTLSPNEQGMYTYLSPYRSKSPTYRFVFDAPESDGPCIDTWTFDEEGNPEYALQITNNGDGTVTAVLLALPD